MQSSSFPRIGRRALGTAAVAVVILASCADSDSTTSDTKTSDTTTPAETTVPETTVPETTVPETTVPETTVPETTVPETTVPETTVPETSTPETTVPETTLPEMTAELVQFCFDSEQVYIANRIMTESESPDPTFMAAAMMYTRQAIETAAQSAPDGFQAEPIEAGELLAEIDAVFDAYDYDVEAFVTGPEVAELEPTFARYDEIMVDLTTFLETVCESPMSVLDSQSTKVGLVIADSITWEMLTISNVAGDIRMHVPPDWIEWFGSLDIGEVTFLQASPDNAQMDAGWDVPGVLATTYYVEAGVADASTRLAGTTVHQHCTPTTSEPYTDPVYTGELHRYESCSGTDTGAAVLTATDPELSVEIVLELQFPGGIDDVVLDQVLATFAAGA